MSYFYGNHYFKHKETGVEKKFYKEISNGILLADFDPQTGITRSNTEVYFTSEDFKSHWEKFTFKLPQNKAYNNHLKQFADKVIYELKNYGIEEDKTRNLDEFLGTEVGFSMLRDWIELDDKSNVNNFIDNYTNRFDDEYFEIDTDHVGDIFAFVTAILEAATILINKVEGDINGSTNQDGDA